MCAACRSKRDMKFCCVCHYYVDCTQHNIVKPVSATSVQPGKFCHFIAPTTKSKCMQQKSFANILRSAFCCIYVCCRVNRRRQQTNFYRKHANDKHGQEQIQRAHSIKLDERVHVKYFWHCWCFKSFNGKLLIT
jgi:hypothetical protein